MLPVGPWVSRVESKRRLFGTAAKQMLKICTSCKFQCTSASKLSAVCTICFITSLFLPLHLSFSFFFSLVFVHRAHVPYKSGYILLTTKKPTLCPCLLPSPLQPRPSTTPSQGTGQRLLAAVLPGRHCLTWRSLGRCNNHLTNML